MRQCGKKRLAICALQHNYEYSTLVLTPLGVSSLTYFAALHSAAFFLGVKARLAFTGA